MAIPAVTLIGHPFANIGMGEQLRSYLRSLDSVFIDFGVVDIFRFAPRTDADHISLVNSREIDELPDGIRIFHINGDEVDPVLDVLKSRRMRFSAGFNVIVPAWELPQYPQAWAPAINRFDEVWALSKFIQQALLNAGIESYHIGQSVELKLQPFLSRRYFGISESAFVLLHFFDLTSYALRKNPEAVLEMFRILKKRRPYDDIQLVLKVKAGDGKATDWVETARDENPDVMFLDTPLNSFENVSLISGCDCFVTLHRAEGFGRGAAEAMFLGRLAMGTAWSGNMDYMTEDNALLVNYELRPVPEGGYPHAEGQVWAEADIDHAVYLAEAVLDDPSLARQLGIAAHRDAFMRAGNRAVGVRASERILANS
jgi:glycosyltransferase involved in cell wall biosynthesis